MKKEIYIFGSTVRGEVEQNSDVDVLVISDIKNRKNFFPDEWSVYSFKAIEKLYEDGRLFAWHLHLDSKCIFKDEEKSFLEKLGTPNKYQNYDIDFESLRSLLLTSLIEIDNKTRSIVFEAGIAYTAIRDLAMIASTKLHSRPCYSRYSPYLLPLEFPLEKEIYDLMINARLSSTRGIQMEKASLGNLPTSHIRDWLYKLEKIK